MKRRGFIASLLGMLGAMVLPKTQAEPRFGRIDSFKLYKHKPAVLEVSREEYFNGGVWARYDQEHNAIVIDEWDLQMSIQEGIWRPRSEIVNTTES